MQPRYTNQCSPHERARIARYVAIHLQEKRQAKREHLLIIAGLLAGIACVLTTGF